MAVPSSLTLCRRLELNVSQRPWISSSRVSAGVKFPRFRDTVPQLGVAAVSSCLFLCSSHPPSSTLLLLPGLAAVTKDGSIIHKNGLMSGGASGLQRRAKRWEAVDMSGVCVSCSVCLEP